jgi:hypothetical protein
MGAIGPLADPMGMPPPARGPVAACTARWQSLACDPIDASAPLDLLGDDRQAELLLERPGDGAAHRVLLPIHRLGDLLDRGALRLLQHVDQLSLLGAPAGADLAGWFLALALYPLRLPRRRWRGLYVLIDVERLEPGICDDERLPPSVFLAPGRKIAGLRHFADELLDQQPGRNLVAGTAGRVSGRRMPRSSRCAALLRITSWVSESFGMFGSVVAAPADPALLGPRAPLAMPCRAAVAGEPATPSARPPGMLGR